MKHLAKAVISCGLSASLVAGVGSACGLLGTFAYAEAAPAETSANESHNDSDVFVFKNKHIQESMWFSVLGEGQKLIHKNKLTYGDLKQVYQVSFDGSDSDLKDLSDLDAMPNIKELFIRVGPEDEQRLDVLLQQFAAYFKNRASLEKITLCNAGMSPEKIWSLPHLKEYTNIKDVEISGFDLYYDSFPPQVLEKIKKEQQGDGTMYRLYNPWTGEHLFTISPKEKDNDVAAGWTFEGTVGKALLEKGDPVYRLLNPTTGEHHYTMAQDEVKNCVAAGWKDEGVVFYSAKKDDKGAIAMVSLYNPYREAFYHHYTSDEGEIQARVADGWKNEGPKFYLVK